MLTCYFFQPRELIFINRLAGSVLIPTFTLRESSCTVIWHVLHRVLTNLSEIICIILQHMGAGLKLRALGIAPLLKIRYSIITFRPFWCILVVFEDFFLHKNHYMDMGPLPVLFTIETYFMTWFYDHAFSFTLVYNLIILVLMMELVVRDETFHKH